MDDLRQIQCVRDSCRRVFYLCSRCDRGHMHCSDECRGQTQAEHRRASKQLYWKSFDGRFATAQRVRAYRERRAIRP